MLSSQAIRGWRAVHTWTSLVCTLFLLLLCLTGLPLIFHDEIDGWLNPDPPFSPAPAGAPAANLDTIVRQAEAAYPGQFVRFVFPDDDAPQVFVLLAPNQDGEAKAIHRMTFDARTGGLREDELRTRAGPDVMDVILRLHAFLLMGLPGELLLGLMGLLFVVAVVSGVVLYAPFMRKLDFGTVRKRGSRRLMWLDLHNLLGVVTLVWVLVVGATGVMNTLSTPLFGLWELTDVARLLKPYEHQAPVVPAASLQAATETAKSAVPGSLLASVTYPARFQSSPEHYVVWLKGDRTLTSRLLTPVLVDARSGRLAAVARMPWYLRALEVSRPLHFGDYGGVGLKLLWGALDLMTIIVLGSGVYLWASKRWAPAGRTTDESDPIAAEVAA